MKEKSPAGGILSRWSRRKQQQQTRQEESPVESVEADKFSASQPTVNKDTNELPLWQQENIDPETRQQALRDLFRKPSFNQTDGLEEYENDYNYQGFASLGPIVTHEMKRVLERQLAEQPNEQTKQIGASSDSSTVEQQDNDQLTAEDQQGEKPIA